MTDIIQTRYRSSAIVQNRASTTSSPSTRQHLTQPQQPATASPSSSSSHSINTPSHSHRTSASSLLPSAARYCTDTHSTRLPYSPASPTQQSRPDPAALRPSSGLVPGTPGNRLRSGSNPFLNRDSLLGPSSALPSTFNTGISASENLLEAQRRAYRESRENSSSGSNSSSGGLAALSVPEGGSKTYLNETNGHYNSNRSRATPSPNPGAYRSSGVTGGISYSSPGGTRARAVTSADTGLAERPSYGTPMARDRSSGGSSASVNTLAKSPSPLPRTHSHSVSVPSVYSSRVSTQSPVQPLTVSSPPPPLPRYSTKPTTTSANSSLSTSNSSLASSTATSTTASSVQGSQGAAAGTSPLGVASAVDVVGKRLREQQLQDRFKAAQDFIERTVGKPLSSSDLHESLKDGVILCRLANRLRPGTVEQISLKNLPFVKVTMQNKTRMDLEKEWTNYDRTMSTSSSDDPLNSWAC
ncbi:MAG: hypothetical protein J3R72DRAFT_172876 [Linnemannia gamsii]|nr:MAG: hypothetical protein J3R72DRAFT_172876 [Linnemannia gamsii]